MANPRLQIERPEPAVQRVFDSPVDELVAAHIRYIKWYQYMMAQRMLHEPYDIMYMHCDSQT